MTITTYFTKQTDVRSIILEHLENANSQVLIAVAWFTEKSLFNKLLEIQEKRVNVELVITNHEFNHNSHNDYELLNANGGFFCEIGNDSQLMHMKFCVVDFDTVISGSANWSNRAFEVNNEEVTVVTENPQRAQDFITEFERLKLLSGKIKSLNRELNISRVLKDFNVIKALISAGDSKMIEVYANKLRNIEEVEHIYNKLTQGQLEDALKCINTFTKNYTQLISVSKIEKEQLLMEINLISYQIEIIDIERVEAEAIIDQFNHRYIIELNPLISKLLRLKKKIFIKLRDKGIIDESYEEVEEEFTRVNEEYEEEKEIDIPVLDEEDSKTIKTLYREAASLCHPDSPKCIYQDTKEAETVFHKLNSAYKINDIETVNYILMQLRSGKNPEDISTFDELEQLRTKLEALKMKCHRLVIELNEIKTSSGFQTIISISNWDTYFEEQKKNLEQEYKTLSEKYVSNEQ